MGMEEDGDEVGNEAYSCAPKWSSSSYPVVVVVVVELLLVRMGVVAAVGEDTVAVDDVVAVDLSRVRTFDRGSAGS